jgi:hypothetical protein
LLFTRFSYFFHTNIEEIFYQHQSRYVISRHFKDNKYKRREHFYLALYDKYFFRGNEFSILTEKDKLIGFYSLECYNTIF